MTVKVSDRSESKVEYVEQMRQLCVRVAQITANGPKKYRATYADELMRLSLQAVGCVTAANAMYVSTQADFEERRRLLQKGRALTYSIEAAAKLYLDTVAATNAQSKAKSYARMADLGERLNRERGLIKGVLDSDRKRYNARKAVSR